MNRGIYVASRTHHAAMWRRYRADGYPIISTWIDEAEVGQTADLGKLWMRIVREVSGAARFVLYIEPADFPLKVALIEVGMALSAVVPIRVVVPKVELEPRSMRSIGSWVKHPFVHFNETLEAALQ